MGFVRRRGWQFEIQVSGRKVCRQCGGDEGEGRALRIGRKAGSGTVESAASREKKKRRRRRRRRTMKVEALKREFRYNGGLCLPDPNPNLTVAEVINLYATTYPEKKRKKEDYEGRSIEARIS